MKHYMKFKPAIWNGKTVASLGMALLLGAALGRVQAASLVVAESGDFSGDLANPTQISPTLVVGTNIIQGYVSGSTFLTDQDYFRITLPAGSRVASLSLKVSNYTTSGDTSGFFDVQPTDEGNGGSVSVAGNSVQVVPAVIAVPTNIILHAVAPFAGLGLETYYNYEVQVVVAPIEVVAGAAIYRAVEITFPSESGQYYQLQYTEDLNSDNWSDVGAHMLGTGGTMSAFDTTRHANQRFYRVVKQ